MKTIVFLLVLASFVVSKDDLLQNLYDGIVKSQSQMSSAYYQYLRNTKVNIQMISKIVDKSTLFSLEKVGIPKEMAEKFKDANWASIVTCNGFQMKMSANSVSYVFQIGAAKVKEEKGRFAYFEVSIDAEPVQQKERVVIQHKKGKKTWSEIKYIPRSLKQEDLELIKKYLKAKAEADLLLRLKTLIEINTDDDNFLAETNNLKFLA